MIKEIRSKIVDEISPSANEIVSYLNIYNYALIRKRPEIYNQIDYFTLDGFVLALWLKLFNNKRIKRQSPDFSSYFKDLFSSINRNNETLYILGAEEHALESFVSKISQKYKQIRIIGYNNGYDYDLNDIILELKDKNPNYIFLGLGTPTQEQIAIELKMQVGLHSRIFTCGAFISQTAHKGLQYYPNYINKMNLRWVYRIIQEPYLLKRYLIEYPKGLFLLTKDRFL